MVPFFGQGCPFKVQPTKTACPFSPWKSTGHLSSSWVCCVVPLSPARKKTGALTRPNLVREGNVGMNRLGIPERKPPGMASRDFCWGHSNSFPGQLRLGVEARAQRKGSGGQKFARCFRAGGQRSLVFSLTPWLHRRCCSLCACKSCKPSAHRHPGCWA